MHTEDRIIIYQWKNWEIQLQMDIKSDTVWARQEQIAELFGVDRTVVNKHIRNVINTDELDPVWVCAKFAHTADDGKVYQVMFYNLDMILAVGYRTNSANAIKFRQWATTRLREYLVQGYSINQSRLDELGQTIKLLTEKGKKIDGDEAKWLLDIIASYTDSFVTLNRYDTGDLEDGGDTNVTYIIDYTEAKDAIWELKMKLLEQSEANEIFGNEKDQSFVGILSNIIATFDSVYLYPTIEEQAAHLLYFVIKDHPFTDGNKRIGAFLFIWFLERNRHRFKKNGEVKINDTGLTTLALLIAQSDPREKEMMVRLVVNLINEK
jgi:death-on-curing family protein